MNQKQILIVDADETKTLYRGSHRRGKEECRFQLSARKNGYLHLGNGRLWGTAVLPRLSNNLSVGDGRPSVPIACLGTAV